MKRILIISVFIVAIRAQLPLSFVNLMNTKHVNLSLETAFVFEPKDSNYDVSMIKTLRSFLDSLQHAVNSKAQLRTTATQTYYTLSRFLHDLGRYIIGYTNDDIKRFAVALQTVVEDYYPSGTVFHKIFFDPRLKAFIKNSLKEWTETKPKHLRKDLEAMYKVETYSNTFVNLVKTLNVLFDEEDGKQLKKYAEKFAKFPKTQKKLESVIDKTIDYVVFQRYEMLNFTMKSIVLDEMSKVSEYVSVAFKNRSVDPEFMLRKRSFDNLTLLDLVSKENSSDIPQNATEFSGSEREDFSANPNDSLEKIIKSSEEDNVSLKNTTDKNEIKEIILNKVIEIDVKNNVVQAGSGNDTRIRMRSYQMAY